MDPIRRVPKEKPPVFGLELDPVFLVAIGVHEAIERGAEPRFVLMLFALLRTRVDQAEREYCTTFESRPK